MLQANQASLEEQFASISVFEGAEPQATKNCCEARSHLALDAWSVNSVATREKYFLILIQRLGLGMQPLCAWIAWIRAISLAISLRGDIEEHIKKFRVPGKSQLNTLCNTH